MTTNPRQVVILSLLGTATIAIAGSVFKGSLPSGRRMFAIGVVYVGLAATADLAPKVTAPMAGLVLVSVALTEGVEAARAIGSVGGGKGPLVEPGRGESTPDDTPTSGGGNFGAFTRGGGPEDHGARPLGNWQSDNAYDLMGSAGQPVYLPSGGTVTAISGKPGGSPQFAGYGVTINGAIFYKHLGTLGPKVKVGAVLPAGTLLGTLDASTRGGPHLHIAAKARSTLDRLVGFLAGD